MVDVGASPAAEEFVGQLLTIDPLRRISVEDARKHSFVLEAQQRLLDGDAVSPLLSLLPPQTAAEQHSVTAGACIPSMIVFRSPL
jgi:hypothetical protein